MFGKRVSLLALCLTCSACATASEPRIEIREVRVPIPVKCATDPGPRPEYPDTDAAIAGAPNVFELAKLYRAGRALRIGREAELEASVAGCR
jgi:Fe-S oxidoreductase